MLFEVSFDSLVYRHIILPLRFSSSISKYWSVNCQLCVEITVWKGKFKSVKSLCIRQRRTRYKGHFVVLFNRSCYYNRRQWDMCVRSQQSHLSFLFRLNKGGVQSHRQLIDSNKFPSLRSCPLSTTMKRLTVVIVPCVLVRFVLKS